MCPMTLPTVATQFLMAMGPASETTMPCLVATWFEKYQLLDWFNLISTWVIWTSIGQHRPFLPYYRY